jgi:hypothetical protein
MVLSFHPHFAAQPEGPTIDASHLAKVEALPETIKQMLIVV